jgi:hypothetical protein
MIFIPLISFLLTVSALDYSNPKGWADSSYAKMMAKYKHDLNIQIRESAKMEYEAQFQANPPLQEDQIESPAVKIEKYQQTAANILSKVGPVLNQSLYEIAYNPNGEYYEWNESANGWVLPSDPSTALSVNGSALNAQTLSQKYQNALKTALSDYAIQKRGFATDFGTKIGESFAKLIKHDPKYFANGIPKEIEIKSQHTSSKYFDNGISKELEIDVLKAPRKERIGQRLSNGRYDPQKKYHWVK